MTEDQEKKLRELLSGLTEQAFMLCKAIHGPHYPDFTAEQIEEQRRHLSQSREAIVSFVRENCGLEGYVHMPKEEHLRLLAQVKEL